MKRDERDEGDFNQAYYRAEDEKIAAVPTIAQGAHEGGKNQFCAKIDDGEKADMDAVDGVARMARELSEKQAKNDGSRAAVCA